MAWNLINMYREKLCTAAEAVEGIQSGAWIDYGLFNGKPVACDKALADRKDDLHDIVIVTAVTVPPVPEVIVRDPEGKVFTFLDYHFGPITRVMQDMRPNVFYNPMQYGESESYFELAATEDKNKIGFRNRDVFIVRTAPMDENGYFNWGIHNSLSSVQAKTAATVIVEINHNIPVALGGCRESIHISEVDHIVEGDGEALAELPILEPTEVDQKIASHVIEHLTDGCCIQLGIGGLPNALGQLINQSDLKELGANTEMLVDAYMALWESGKLTNRMKKIDRGKTVYTFALGSKKLYDWVHDNPALASCDVDYANHPLHLSQIDKLISINQALQVDLYTQVSAESSGFKQISGNGGMWDYTCGAFWSPGGRSLICLPSTHRNKNGVVESRIVPFFQPGTITTLTRVMINYIVTEFGWISLKGDSTWIRAEKIISIAHPDFRDELIKAAEEQKIWHRSNKIS